MKKKDSESHQELLEENIVLHRRINELIGLSDKLMKKNMLLRRELETLKNPEPSEAEFRLVTRNSVAEFLLRERRKLKRQITSLENANNELRSRIKFFELQKEVKSEYV